MRRSVTISPVLNAGPGRTVFFVLPDRSALVIEANSNVGMIMFAAGNIAGHVELPDCEAHDTCPPVAHIELRADELTSGNTLYDAELRQRIDARRFPVVVVDLRSAAALGAGRYRVTGDLTFRGITHSLVGTVTRDLAPSGRLVVTGEQRMDMRDFTVAPPKMLMLRIEPEVLVRVHLEADAGRAA